MANETVGRPPTVSGRERREAAIRRRSVMTSPVLLAVTAAVIAAPATPAAASTVPQDMVRAARREPPLHTLPQVHSARPLFRGGERARDGTRYHSFRIPSLVRTPRGTLLAFAEGRVRDSRDHGNIDLVYRRSIDGGVTWSNVRKIAGRADRNTWGNPTAVVDGRSGNVWVFLSWNSAAKSLTGGGGTKRIDRWGDRRVFLTHSTDDGRSWRAPRDMSRTLLPRGYTWDAVGPGVGTQTTWGPRPGRLLVPALGRNIYSDNGGRTWKYQRIPRGTGEGAIVELKDGSLLRNDRAARGTWDKARRRWVSRGSIEGGFSRFRPDRTLVDSKVQGSILRYPGVRSRILFLNPASATERCRMRLRVSYDEGRTWPVGRAIHDHPARPATSCDRDQGGYSSLAPTTPRKVGVLVEVNGSPGNPGGHRSIEFHDVNLSWVLDGRPEPRARVPERRAAERDDDATKPDASHWGRFRNGWTSLMPLGGWGPPEDEDRPGA